MTSAALTAAASRYVDRKVTRGARSTSTSDARQGLAWQMYHATPAPPPVFMALASSLVQLRTPTRMGANVSCSAGPS